MAHYPGKFVWFELLTDDSQKARGFYGELFGWNVKSLPMGDFNYDMIQVGEKGIGGFAPSQGQKQSWHTYMSVSDVDASAKAVTAAGGKIIAPAFDVPTVGRMARVSDPQGAIFSLFHSTEDDAEDVNRAPNGSFSWNELWTHDDKAAVAFYEKALGYSHTDVDMGPMGTYRVLKVGDARRGGIMKSPDAKVSPMWLPYVNVEDCDRTAARAKKLGGTLVSEPSEIPNVGRFAITLDPQGAAIAFLQPR